MLYEVEGTLVRATKTETIQTQKGPQPKRTFWLETNEQYAQTLKLELFGEEKCKMFKTFAKGDYVKVKFSIDGRVYTSKKTGEEDVFNKLSCFKIEKLDLDAQETEADDYDGFGEDAPQASKAPIAAQTDDEDLPF